MLATKTIEDLKTLTKNNAKLFEQKNPMTVNQ